ncbi:MAG: hypothetical protein E7774_08115 [Bradyrhizobium sp.]|nr:MAG: hypothetical protein E7774_08115 [Bradyrhizobium sp.]
MASANAPHMLPERKPRTILVTFAGRRDRMRLLTRYVDAAIARGLIDEWHVWEFARNPEDTRWLRERFPTAQATPNNSLDYFASPRLLALRDAVARLQFSVRATNDVHIGLRRLSGDGPDYEIVIGGWGNQASALRKFDQRGLLSDPAACAQRPAPHLIVGAAGVLPEFAFAEVDLRIGEQGLSVSVAGEILLNDPEPVGRGDFDVLYRTGFGANGDWRFPEFAAQPQRRFVVGPESYYPSDAMFYNRAYQYYGATAGEYANDVIVKCDDDIVYFDLDRFAEFVALRRSAPQYLLVSANVVNNGVCAFFQQAAGVIPPTEGAFEPPPGGFGGSLWAEGKKAEKLHRFFLADPARFTRAGGDPLIWNERISINFIALLGADLPLIPDLMRDDEHDLCYGVRKRAKKVNGVDPRFVASHLSFWKQDADMNVEAILRDYEALADRGGVAPERARG